MNNPNPFVPKGSLFEQQSLRRSRLKIAVTCFLAVGVLSLVGLLIEGCKREKPVDENANTNTNADNFNPPMTDTNPPVADTNVYVPPPPMPTNPVPPVADNAATGSEYIVVAGDTLAKIAKKNGVTLKALEAANPGVDSRKLKIKQKIVIPAGAKTAADNSTSAAPVADSGMETYKIKSGDTLTKIAKAHGTTVKAIQAANNLTTTKIAVGKTLKIPAKSAAAITTAPAPPVMDTPPPAPLPAQTTTSSAAPGPVK